MSKCIAIVQDVDFDQIVVDAGSKIEVFLHVAFERLQAAHGRWIVGHREVREDDEWPGSKLMTCRHQRLAVVGERRAARRTKPGARSPRERLGGRCRPNRPMVSAIRHIRLPIAQESGRWRRSFRDRLLRIPFSIALQNPFQSLSGDNPQGRYRPKESQEVGPVSARDRIETDAETRQVLDPPVPAGWDGADAPRPGRSR